MNITKIIEDIEKQKSVRYKSELAPHKFYRVLVFVSSDETKKYRVEIFDRKKVSSNASFRYYFYHVYNNITKMKNVKTNLYLPVDEVFTVEYIALMYIYPEKGNLMDMLTSCNKFSEEQVLLLALDIYNCIESLYKKGQILKYLPLSCFLVQNELLMPHVVLYCQKEGENRDYQETHTDLLIRSIPIPNLILMPPEALFGKKLGRQSSYWCLGMIIYVMLTGVFPFHIRSLDELTRIYTNMPNIPLDFGDIQNFHLKKLIHKLLQIDTIDRINARDLGIHMSMFGKIYSVQQEKCREDLFELKKFRVTKKEKSDTLTRVRSAKLGTKPGVKPRCESMNTHIIDLEAPVAFKSQALSHMKIRQCHQIGLDKRIDKIVSDQLRLDYDIRVEEKKAEVIGMDDGSEAKPVPIKIKGLEKSPITMNKCVSVKAFNRELTIIDTIKNDEIRLQRIISAKTRPGTAASRVRLTEPSLFSQGSRSQALNIQKLSMSKLLSPINLYPKQFVPNFN